MDRSTLLRHSITISLGFVIGYYVFFGPRGLIEYFKLKSHINKEKMKISRLEKNIGKLQSAINRNQTNPYELEKVARYDFDMGYTNELVYLLPKN
jgi:cell division protein FtsB